MNTKVFLMLLILMCSVFVVSADNDNRNDDDFDDDHREGMESEEDDLEMDDDDFDRERNRFQEQLRNMSNYTIFSDEGVEVRIREKENERLEIKAKGISAEAEKELEIFEEEFEGRRELRVRLSNGKNSEIKIMPDVASERALERLRLNVCSEENNCKIELKEVGQDKEVEVAYEFEADKEARVLGIFKTKMKVKAQVSAENGELIRSERPWWAFLASEVEE